MQGEDESSLLGASSLLQDVARKARATLTSIHLKKLQTVDNTTPSIPPERSSSSRSTGKTLHVCS